MILLPLHMVYVRLTLVTFIGKAELELCPLGVVKHRCVNSRWLQVRIGYPPQTRNIDQPFWAPCRLKVKKNTETLYHAYVS